VLLGCRDPKGLREPAFPGIGDDHRPAVLHSLGPAKIKKPTGERGSDSAPYVRPAFRPVEAEATEMSALCACRQIDPELRENLIPSGVISAASSSSTR
jgi:hypothetical protein